MSMDIENRACKRVEVHIKNKNIFNISNLQSLCERNTHDYNWTVINKIIRKDILKNGPNNRLIKKE